MTIVLTEAERRQFLSSNEAVRVVRLAIVDAMEIPELKRTEKEQASRAKNKPKF